MRKFLIVALIILIPGFVMLSCKTKQQSKQGAPEMPSGKRLTPEELLQNTALFLDANKEKFLGNDDKALGLFAQCIKRNPAYDPAMYEMASLLNKRRQYEDALVLIRNAMKYNPGNKWYQVLLAEILMNKRDYNDAVKAYKTLCEKFPNDLENYYKWGEACLYAGSYSDAIKAYDAIENKTGISEDISIQKEKLYLQINKPQKAIEEINALIKQYPNETKYYGLLADLYMAINQADKAFETYQKILQIDPNDPVAHLSLSEYYRVQNKKTESFEELKKAFSSPALDIDTKVKILLDYYTAAGNNKEISEQAYTLANLLIQAHPDDAKAYSIYGDFLVRDKRYNEARDTYRKVISIDSSRYVIWEQLMFLESELGDYNALLKESERAIDLFPEQAPLYMFNGGAHLQLKNYSGAVKILNIGLKLVATDKSLQSKFYTYLGDAYYKLNDADNSFVSYELALAADPQNDYVMNNYAYYLLLQGKYTEKAVAMAKKANDLKPGNANYLDTYAWALYKSGKLDEAIQYQEKCMQAGGDKNASVLEHYGDMMFKSGNKDKAVEYWQKAASITTPSELLNKKLKDKQLYE
ncbi:MAG: tetratricopeptide repeat protein [Bacteroidota bacterium]